MLQFIVAANTCNKLYGIWILVLLSKWCHRTLIFDIEKFIKISDYWKISFKSIQKQQSDLKKAKTSTCFASQIIHKITPLKNHHKFSTRITTIQNDDDENVFVLLDIDLWTRVLKPVLNQFYLFNIYYFTSCYLSLSLPF